jgi:hypothetical protein
MQQANKLQEISLLEMDSNESKKLYTFVVKNRKNKTRAWYERALWYINACTCALHLASGTTVCFLWSDWPIPVQTSFINWELKNTTSGLGCGEGNCFVKADFTRWNAEISILGLVVFFHACSFAWQFAVLWPTSLRELYHANLAKGYNAYRWIEYSVSAPVMLIVISAILGEIDVVVYFLLAVCTSVLMGLGYLQEVHMRETIVPHVMGWVLYVFTWAGPTFTFAVSLVRGSNPPPDRVLFYIWLTYVLMISLFGCFGFVQVAHVRMFYRFKPSSAFVWFTLRPEYRKRGVESVSDVEDSNNYYVIEYAYGILSATTKVSLAVLLILLIRARNDAVKLEFSDSS